MTYSVNIIPDRLFDITPISIAMQHSNVIPMRDETVPFMNTSLIQNPAKILLIELRGVGIMGIVWIMTDKLTESVRR